MINRADTLPTLLVLRVRDFIMSKREDTSYDHYYWYCGNKISLNSSCEKILNSFEVFKFVLLK